MVYWLASALRPIHSSHLIIVQPPTLPRTLHSHLPFTSRIHHHHLPLLAHEVEEAPVPGRPVGLGHFRTFPNGITDPSSSFRLQINLTFKVISIRA